MTTNSLRGVRPGTHPGDELLAAFVDGRLLPEERESVLQHLASCEDCYEVFSATVSVQSEAAEEDEAVGALSLAPVRPWRRPVVWRRWLPAAALVAAAVALIVAAPWRGSRLPDLPVSGLVPAEVASETSARVRSEIDTHGWPQTLGTTVFGDREATAFRLGVRAVELEIALAAADRQTSRILSHRIEALLAGTESGEILAHAYYGEGRGGLREMLIEKEPPEATRALHREADAALVESDESPAVVDPLWYGFGKWAQAGSLAAAAGRSDHFESQLHRRFLRHLAQQELPPAIGERLGEIEALLATDDPPHTKLETAFGELITVAGGGQPPEAAAPAPR